MTNCKECGVPLTEEDAFCPNCGAATGKPVIQAPKTVMDIQPDPSIPLPVPQAHPVSPSVQTLSPILQGPMEPIQIPDWQQQMANRNRAQNKNYAVAIKVMLIVSCVVSARVFLITLLWCVPMTVFAWRKLDKEERIGTAFKVCTFIFVSKVAGILMFLMKDEPPYINQY